MRESSLVPTNLLDWPECDSLLPEQKLIFCHLWANKYIGMEGFGQVAIKPMAATLGFAPDSLVGGLNDLNSKGLIMFDQATGEVFIPTWYRFHKFNTIGLNILKNAIEKIQSSSIKKAVLEKSSTCFQAAASSAASSKKAAAAPNSPKPKPPTPSAADAATPKPQPLPAEGKSMVRLENPADQLTYKYLCQNYGEGAVEGEARLILAEGKQQPWLSNIKNRLQAKQQQFDAQVEKENAAKMARKAGERAASAAAICDQAHAEFEKLSCSQQEQLIQEFREHLADTKNSFLLERLNTQGLDKLTVSKPFFTWFSKQSEMLEA